MILNTSSLGEGPDLVLLHGLFGAAKNLGVLARGLGATHRVVSMDLRNHGASPHSAAMDFETMAGDIAETMSSLGVKKAAVAGHSLGGKTAMMLALTNPERVTRLAVLDIAPVSYQHGYDDYVKAMQAIELTPALTRHAADAALSKVVPEPPMRAFLLNNLILGAAPHWRMGLDEIAAAMPDLLAWRDPAGVTSYTGKVLFLRGGESYYIQPSAEAAIDRLFPHAERKTVEGASHWLHADKPQQVLSDLQEFFQS